MGKVWNKPQVRIGNSTDLEHLGLITTPKTWGLYTGGGGKLLVDGTCSNWHIHLLL